MKLDSACPRCRKHETIHIKKHTIACDSCEFSVQYLCPICHSDISHDSFSHDINESFHCRSCQNTIPLFKIKQIIDTSLIVNYSERCKLCNSPTVHQPAVNLANRCFFYPNCSGQAGLFGVQKSLVFLDFETSGLDMQVDEIIEVGALKIEPNGMELTFQKLVKPSTPIHEAITKITGISNEMVENASSIDSVIRELFEFIGDSTVVAHNADFDLLWLVSSYLRHDVTIGTNSVICTLNWAKIRHESRCSLGALTKKYGIGHQNAHRALADAVATKELFFIFDNNDPQSKPVQSIQDFIDMSQKIVDQSKALKLS